jgi:tripartite-type tricarboxylate transporter receptor subunit TctC
MTESALILHTGSSAITSPICKKLPPYDPVTDFAWIAHMSTAPFVIAIDPKIPVTDLKSFIAYAKAQDGKMAYGSAGVGTTIHLAAEMFASLAGFKAMHVPYRGSAPAVIDAMSGTVSFLLETVGTLLPYHRAGTLRVLALFADERIAMAPDIPTAREQGIDFSSGTPNLLAAPPKTPASVIDPVAAAIRNVMAEKSLQDKLLAQGIQPVINSGPAAAKAYVAAEIARLKPVVERLGIAT